MNNNKKIKFESVISLFSNSALLNLEKTLEKEHFDRLKTLNANKWKEFINKPINNNIIKKYKKIILNCFHLYKNQDIDMINELYNIIPLVHKIRNFYSHEKNYGNNKVSLENFYKINTNFKKNIEKRFKSIFKYQYELSTEEFYLFICSLFLDSSEYQHLQKNISYNFNNEEKKRLSELLKKSHFLRYRKFIFDNDNYIDHKIKILHNLIQNKITFEQKNIELKIIKSKRNFIFNIFESMLKFIFNDEIEKKEILIYKPYGKTLLYIKKNFDEFAKNNTYPKINFFNNDISKGLKENIKKIKHEINNKKIEISKNKKGKIEYENELEMKSAKRSEFAKDTEWVKFTELQKTKYSELKEMQKELKVLYDKFLYKSKINFLDENKEDMLFNEKTIWLFKFNKNKLLNFKTISYPKIKALLHNFYDSNNKLNKEEFEKIIFKEKKDRETSKLSFSNSEKINSLIQNFKKQKENSVKIQKFINKILYISNYHYIKEKVENSNYQSMVKKLKENYRELISFLEKNLSDEYVKKFNEITKESIEKRNNNNLEDDFIDEIKNIKSNNLSESIIMIICKYLEKSQNIFLKKYWKLDKNIKRNKKSKIFSKSDVRNEKTTFEKIEFLYRDLIKDTSSPKNKLFNNFREKTLNINIYKKTNNSSNNLFNPKWKKGQYIKFNEDIYGKEIKTSALKVKDNFKWNIQDYYSKLFQEINELLFIEEENLDEKKISTIFTYLNNYKKTEMNIVNQLFINEIEKGKIVRIENKDKDDKKEVWKYLCSKGNIDIKKLKFIPNNGKDKIIDLHKYVLRNFILHRSIGKFRKVFSKEKTKKMCEKIEIVNSLNWEEIKKIFIDLNKNK